MAAMKMAKNNQAKTLVVLRNTALISLGLLSFVSVQAKEQNKGEQVFQAS